MDMFDNYHIIFPNGEEYRGEAGGVWEDEIYNNVEGWVIVNGNRYYAKDNKCLFWESPSESSKFYCRFIPNKRFTKNEVERLLKLKAFI